MMKKGSDLMYKKKILVCLTALLMLAVVIGIFYYASYIQNHNHELGGTFVKAFGQTVEECSI